LEPANLLAYLKLPTKVLASVGLVASGILFLPASWVAALGLAQIRKQYPALLGVAILLAVAILIIESTVFVSGWLRSRERPKPYERYRTDEFFGLRWRWIWYLGEVVGARAFCPRCDLQLEARSQTAGIMDMPTGEVHYYCPCGATKITLPAPNPVQVAHAAGLLAEREARNRGLLRD
jgi:hypothetical protein